MRVFPRLPYPALVAVGLVLGTVALTPGTTAASCGSYVTIEGADHSGQPPVPAVPCHGPGCSKAPAAPAMPMTAPVNSSSGSDQSAVEGESATEHSGETCWRRPLSVDRHPTRLTPSIFHPPRAS